MFKTNLRRWLPMAILAVTLGLIAFNPTAAQAQERKLKSEVKPAYPELAKRMNISGTVKIEVTIEPNGTVKTTKVMGGPPLLIAAAEDAAKKRKYEAASDETKEIVVYNFNPNQ